MTALILISLIPLVYVSTTAFASDPSKGTVIAELITATRNCQTHLGVPRGKAGNPWVPHSSAYRAWQKNLWTNRLHSCRAALHERARQWNWHAWLPSKWYRVGSCETGGGGDPNWFHSNSDYVSAFGIQRGAFDGAYDHDARAVGMPPWSDTRPPSPWQQYETALSHYAHHGGFSGWGCGGA